MSLHLFAGLRVRDFRAARPWYERLLGEATVFSRATEAVWTLAEDRSVYIVEHAEGAVKSVATIFVDDLDAYLAAIAARGMEADEIEVPQRSPQGGVPRSRRQRAGLRRSAAPRRLLDLTAAVAVEPLRANAQPGADALSARS